MLVESGGSVSIDQIWGSIIRSAALNPLYSSWAQGDWSGDVIKRLLFPGPGPHHRDQNKSGRNIPAWPGLVSSAQEAAAESRVMAGQHATEEANTPHWHKHRQP